MKETLKKIDIYELLLYASLLICTVLLGGFNWHNCMIPLLLFFVYLIKGRRNISRNINALLPIVLLITGFISIILTKGDKQNALYEYEQILCFILAFYVGLSIKNEDKIFKYILVCAVTTAGVGLFSYCNIIKIEDFTFNDRYILRLQSFLKYANTTAVLLGCGYFATLKLFDTYHKKVLTYIASCSLIAFYLTISKAAIPLFIVLGTFLFIVQRKYTSCFILQNVVCMIFTILIILSGFAQQQTIKLLLIIICVIISGGIINNEPIQKKLSNKLLIILWFLGLGVFLFLGCLLLVSRDISIFATLFKRFDYMRNALVLLKDHWLTGIGPGAWKYYQYAVQTTQYNVTDIHNGWLQIWLEYGIIFFVMLLGVIIKATLIFVRKKMYVYSVIVLFIITHTLVDINLSFGTILMILGLMAGFALKDSKEIRLGKPIIYGTLILCFVILGYMICECVVRSMFEHSYLQKRNEQAIKYSAILEKICPYDSNLQISIAALTQEDAGVRIKRAIKISPLDPNLMEADIEYLISHENKDILEKIKKYSEMAKYQEKVYVKAKEYAKQTFENNLCTNEEYEEFLLYIKNKQNELGVADRNELLNEITKQKKRSKSR